MVVTMSEINGTNGVTLKKEQLFVKRKEKFVTTTTVVTCMEILLISSGLEEEPGNALFQ